MDDVDDIDSRLLYMMNLVSNCIKIKPDKWHKMMSNEQYKHIVLDYLNVPDSTVLFITLSDGILAAYNEFDFSLKCKSVYFVKKQPCYISEEDVSSLLIVGDLLPYSISQLVSMLQNVFIPLLLNGRNHGNWPSVCRDDINKRCLEINDAVSEIQGVIQGKVYLPIPEQVQHLVGDWSSVPSSEIDLKLKNSVESAVIKWMQHVNCVISQSSESLFTSDCDPSIETEVNFWRHKLENLEGILHQLKKKPVKKMFYILKITNSAYHLSLKQLYDNVEEAVTDCRCIIKHLAPLSVYVENLNKAEFKDAKNLLATLMQMFCLTWVHCEPVRQASRIINIIKEILNSVIAVSRRYLNESSLFDGDTSETLTKLATVMDTLNYFMKVFDYSKCNLQVYFGNKEHVAWTFETIATFKAFHDFNTRLEIIQKLFSTVIQYKDLEKIEFGGTNGSMLTLKSKEIFEEFSNTLDTFSNLDCKLLDLGDNKFVENYVQFMDKIDDLDKRLSTLFGLAFEQCSTADSFLKLVLMQGDILKRPIILNQVSRKYSRYRELLENELNSVQNVYEFYRMQFKTSGFIILDKCFPPCAGSISAVIQLRKRIEFVINSTQFLSNVIRHSKCDLSLQLRKCDQLLLLLEDVESEIGEKWCEEVPAIIAKYSSDSLFIVNNDRTLELNLNDKLAIALKETRYLTLLKYNFIPECALDLYSRSDELYVCSKMLNSMILQYNKIRKTSKLEELNLIEKFLIDIDAEIDDCQINLTWNSDIKEFSEHIYKVTNDLFARLIKAKGNLTAIEKLTNQWNDSPLFYRKDGTGLLYPADRVEQISIAGRRYIEIFETTKKIFRLLDENIRLFCNLPLRSDISQEREDNENHHCDFDQGDVKNVASATHPTSRLLRAARKSIQVKRFEIKSYKQNQREKRLEFSFSNLYSSDELREISINEEREKWDSYLLLMEKIVQDGMFGSVTYSDTTFNRKFTQLSPKLIFINARSLNYILDEMRRHRNDMPLFQLSMNLNDDGLITFVPDLDENSESGFTAYVENMLKDVEKMADIVPRILHFDDSRKFEEIQVNMNKVENSILGKVKETILKVKKYVIDFDKYNYLWLEDMDEYLKQFLIYGSQLALNEQEHYEKSEYNSSSYFKETSPKLEDFKTQIDLLMQLRDEILSIDRFKTIDRWLQLDIAHFQDALLNLVDKWSMLFKQYLVDYVDNSLKELKEFIEEAENGLMQPLDDGEYSNLVKVMTYIVNVRDRAPDTDFMFEPLQAIMNVLILYDIEFGEETYCLMQELPDHWSNTKRLCSSAKSAAGPFIQAEVNVIRKRMILFDLQQTVYKDDYKNKLFFKWDCEDPYRDMDIAHDEISQMESTLNHLMGQASLFEIAHIDSKVIQVVRKYLKLAKVLWDYILIVRSWFEIWKNTKWKEINSESIDIELKKLSREIKSLEKDIKEWEIYLRLEMAIKDMITSLREITELQNPAIRDRHWKQLINATKVNFVITDNTTLSDLLALNLHKFEDEVKTIVDKSVKEMSMEKALKEFASTWANLEFQYETHPNIDVKLIRCGEDVAEKLEDNQVQLQNMMSSKFISHFMEEVSEWQQVLANTDQIITMWMEVQRTWLYLQAIFIGSRDIYKQFPEDSNRFEDIDHEFRKLLEEISGTPNVLNAAKKAHLYEKLENLQIELSKCEKALTEFLESKRLIYPRFYFISPTDLLDILANGNQPQRVSKHLPKLYDSVAKLEFGKADSDSNVAYGMYSEDGEYVEFSEKCVCDGQVENWLNNVTDSMQKTGRHNLSEAVAMYEEKSREQWLFDYSAQIALCATQIWWTNEVNMAFARMEEGYENALKDYNKKQVSQLNALISLLLGNLSARDRQKITTICTIDVHSRDVVSRLITEHVESASAFQWQSQLRHRWDTTDKDCFVNICDAEFRYNHEYLGNTSRLVITPLTDRCYITLTQSLHLVMGGAAAGPAGTGKTETTKDLGKALGMMVYVFNCSEQMDYKSCGNIYKGLAQTGAWGCFDEFNRISVDVLSVVAVQVKCVLDAIKSKRSTFSFLGETISLVPTVGMFITMNPGYAGRTELPENLKALYRPCAMVVPDLKLICEIMLVTEGFQHARVLARKFITLYALCKKLLSKQDHYDWGLRAIKSLLVVAGKLKRDEPDKREEEILMRALRDFNIPKIVTDDVPIFISLIHDLFPNINVTRQKDEDFEKQARQAAIDLKLQPEDSFIMKVVQLKELFQVRHSVFIVGSAGTGKTQIWKTLFKAYQNAKMKPYCNVIEPKSVTNDELFGVINPSTREWKDGLFSALIREQAQMDGTGPKWMVMDGDIDPMWIESLNTLMDDNKVLTLASNERISLNPNMRLLFEVSSLHSATPATVSRAGILYINPQDLGWSPYVTSWIETRTSESEKANLTVLFDKYVPTLFESCRTKFKKVIPITDMTHIQMLCTLLDGLLISSNVPRDCPKEWYELYFVFACIWAFGSALYQDQTVDFRSEFTKWWINEFRTVKFPSTGYIFDYYVDNKTKKFLPWKEKIPKFELDFEIPLSCVLVPTVETVRIQYFIRLLIERNKPVMLVGSSGCGKTTILSDQLSHLSEDYLVTNIPFNHYTTSETLQRTLEKPLEKKAGRNYGPPCNKTLIYFVDDINLPKMDKFGTVQPHTLIRQYLNYGGWYDRTKFNLKDIHNVIFVSSMNPSAGAGTIDPKLQRFFYVFYVSYPSGETMFHIYNAILSQYLQKCGHNLPPMVIRSVDTIVQLALSTHSRVCQTFLPTASKFHYLFSTKDLTNLFQGILFSNPECLTSIGKFVRVWMHETYRVYSDKLVDQKDKEIFNKLISENVKKYFPELQESEYNEKPLIYCHFADGIGTCKYHSVSNWSQLYRLLMDAQNNYNELAGSMSLVFFEDAMVHVCRINRILESPRGNALLVGVGGSGKQSLARLAAFISSLEIFQIQINKGYGIGNLKTELANLYIKTGLKNVGVVLLLTDAQIQDENFLAVINDVLACGETLDLFSDDEINNIINTIRSEVKGAGISDTRENCWKFFINRVRYRLKIVLCFSPVGSNLRGRLRKFPAIASCTSIDWFQEWPQEALESVSYKFLSELEIFPEELRSSASLFMAHVHTSVRTISKMYLTNDRRYNYTTPKTFLEYLFLYKKLLQQKTRENNLNIERFQNGIQRLVRCAEQVDELKVNLAYQEVELAEKKEKTEELIKIIEKEAVKTKKEKAIAAEEERKVRIIEEDVAVKQKICEEDLRNAEPMLIAAKNALNILNKSNLTELKSFGSPPAIVANVTAAVMVLLAKKGKIPKDRSWKACKVMMAKLDAFLDLLVNYSIENITPEVVKGIQSYLRNTEFNPDLVRTKSSAAAGLCEWVINIMKYYEVWTIVEPKRKALDQATAEYNAAQSKLAVLNEKIESLEMALQELKEKLEDANQDKENCIQQKEETAEKIDLANRLVKGLASENIRWREGITNLQKAALTLPGDVLLVSAIISYFGCFTRSYRTDLLQNHWLPFMYKLKPTISISFESDPLLLLADDAQMACWNNEGLPNDKMSAENAIILLYSNRWPLIVDPQLQGVRWIKSRYSENFNVLQPNQINMFAIIERCIFEGSTLLIENIEENIDPVLDNLIGRNLIKKGTAIKIGDKEIDFNPNFRLILQTKLGNPHYKPEIQAQTTLINFTVTKDGLEEQLLADVMKIEIPHLEHHKANLTKEQNDYKIKLKDLEDELLEQLSSAGNDVLGDKKLVENLEKSKKTAMEIVEKVSESRMATIKIDEAREQFRPVATRASILYFIMNDLYKINPIYQFSLKAFSTVFHKAIVTSKQSENMQTRIANLMDNITFFVYTYINRGLFQSDRLTFLTLLAIQIFCNTGEINAEELDFLLRFPVMNGITSPVDFLSNKSWGAIKNLSMMDEFRGLDRDIESSAKRWKKFVEGEAPEKDKLPQEWKNKTGLQKLCIMRTIRPDRMTHAVRCFIEEKLGAKYLEDRSVDLKMTYKEMNSTTPVVFILSPGVDPMNEVENLGASLGFATDKQNFSNVSLGQGQEVAAELAIETGTKYGHWVVLQNVHLVQNWLSVLEKKIESSFDNAHPNYRLFISLGPSPTDQYRSIPQSILESSIKITNEPPTGILANLHKAWDNFDQNILDMCSKEIEFKTILFALCYFHACIAERRKFGSQGWNYMYPFNASDLTICAHVLYNYLESNYKVPWDDLTYLFGEIMYGGHITDDWDRRLCQTYLQRFLCPQLLEGEFKLAPNFAVPTNRDYQGYHNYIDTLPTESPVLYGLHPNAEIGVLTTEADNLFKMILELQPHDSNMSSGFGISREDKVRQTLDEILDKIPDEFNMVDMAARMEERTPYVIVVFQECERMNNLTAEIKSSLRKLSLGLKGELPITPDIEELEEFLFLDKVPKSWESKAYPFTVGLSIWFADLLLRIKELEAWVTDFSLPLSVWLGGLFNPQAFLAAVIQTAANKNEWPLDKMSVHCEVTKKQKDELTTVPRDGVFIHGLYMEGARWDEDAACIAVSKLNELYYPMPVIYVRGILQDKQESKDMYECPLYRTRQRGPTYVTTFKLKTKENTSKWILTNTALLLST